MTRPTFPLIACLAAMLLLGGVPVQAEKSDRAKPMVVEANKPGTVDLQRQVVVFSGSVVISQGSMVIRADRVEVRESPDGFRTAVAIGSPSHLASYRQRRDADDEWVEGSAERIEFDARAETLRFTGQATVRRLRGTEPADEITGAMITWDNNAELFSVSGGGTSATNPGGRVRAILSPRSSSTPAVAPATGADLKPSRTLGDKK